MIEGVECPKCKSEIPVQISLNGEPIKMDYVKVDCISKLEDAAYPHIEIYLELDYQKVLENRRFRTLAAHSTPGAALPARCAAAFGVRWIHPQSPPCRRRRCIVCRGGRTRAQ